MWGKIIIPMYRLWLHGLYGLYGPRCLLSPKRPINLISLSWLYDLNPNLDCGTPHLFCILGELQWLTGLHGQWEFPLFFKGQWLSLAFAVWSTFAAGKCMTYGWAGKLWNSLVSRSYQGCTRDTYWSWGSREHSRNTVILNLFTELDCAGVLSYS